MSRILAAIEAIIQDDKGRVLLVKHRKERRGRWQGKRICPGRELELGEEIAMGFRREAEEETNLEIELLTPPIPFDRIVKINEETSLHVIYIDYVARLVGGELKMGSDIGEALWIEKENTSKIWLELHEDTQKLLKIARIA